MTEPPQGAAAVTQERFWAKVDRRGPNECWPWLGGTASSGYGRICIRRRQRPAHQVAWEIENDRAFPDGKNGCHTCDNPICVNPAHIWPGTQSENLRDCVRKGRHGSKPLTHCQRGHAMDQNNRIPTQGASVVANAPGSITAFALRDIAIEGRNPMVEVIQEDRDAAAALWSQLPFAEDIADVLLAVRLGEKDVHAFVQAFARHRIAALFRSGGGDVGYQDAFYELAKLMGIPAQPIPPKQVWEEQMRPRLTAALSSSSTVRDEDA